MESKQVMLLTAENSEMKKNHIQMKKIKSYILLIIMAFVISCTSAGGNAVCSAKENVEVTLKPISSNKKAKTVRKNKKKKNARKKTTNKKSSKKKTDKKKTNKKKTSRKKKSVKERYTIYSTPSHNSFKSYMSYRAVSSSSAQGKLQAKAKTDGDTGIRKVDGRYCVALGSYYCSKIGTKIDLVMENGSVVKCVLADQKANRDTDAKNQKTSDGSIAEFLVDMNKLSSRAKTMGDVSYAAKELKGSIAKVRVYS